MNLLNSFFHGDAEGKCAERNKTISPIKNQAFSTELFKTCKIYNSSGMKFVFIPLGLRLEIRGVFIILHQKVPSCVKGGIFSCRGKIKQASLKVDLPVNLTLHQQTKNQIKLPQCGLLI